MKEYREKKNSSLIFITVLLIFIAIVLSNFILKSFKRYNTTLPIMTNFKDSIIGKGYNILNEKVYKSSDEGIVLFNASEGQRVPMGYSIATINLMTDSSELKDELIKVNAAIDYKKSENEEVTEFKLTDREVYLIDQIQNSIVKDDYKALINNINELDLNTKHSVSISEISDLLGDSIEALEAKKELLRKEISENDVVYYSEFPGIVSYAIDGLEKSYSYANTEKYTYEYLEGHKKAYDHESRTRVEKGEEIFKLIDNFNWKMAIEITEFSKIKDIEIGDELYVIPEGKDKIKGTIENINKSNKRTVLVLNFEEGFENNYKNRINNVEIIVNQNQSLVIPSRAVTKSNRQVGVYVQEIHGLVKFVPISIIKQLGNETYVSVGDKYGNIKIGEQEVKTITINDPIVSNPESINERQILN